MAGDWPDPQNGGRGKILEGYSVGCRDQASEKKGGMPHFGWERWKKSEGSNRKEGKEGRRVYDWGLQLHKNWNTEKKPQRLRERGKGPIKTCLLCGDVTGVCAREGKD